MKMNKTKSIQLNSGSHAITRRSFLLTAAAATAACTRANAASDFPIVDTHTHFYDPAQTQMAFAKSSPLYRTVLPEHWRKLAAPHGIGHTVVVEASTAVEDNQWILDLAAREKCIVGFVGNLDPLTPEFAANLKRFAVNPLFRGVRNRRAGTEIKNIVDKAEFRSSMKVMADAGLSLDVNEGGPANLQAVAKLAGECSDLRIIVDHVGGAGDPTKLSEEWRAAMNLAGKHKNVFCKVSAVVEQVKVEWGKARQDTAFYLPILDHIWECFGEDRVVFGSNWPVSDKGAPFDVVFRVVKEYFSGKGRAAEEKYFWKNSRVVYRWIDRS